MTINPARTRIVEKVIYQATDDRMNINEFELKRLPEDLRNAVIEQTKSVACLIQENHFSFDPLTKTYTLKSISLKKWIKIARNGKNELIYQGYPLAHDQKFRNEWVPGFGTGFAVGKKSIYTAAHCVCKSNSNVLDDQKIAKTIAVFNFRIDDKGNIKTKFSENEVYRIKVKAHQFVKEGGNNGKKIDWAWLELDKDFNGKPLELEFGSVQEYTQLYVIGHPDGLPAKLVSSGTIKSLENDFFTADISMFKGNSGSPVFDKMTKKVIGILVAGNDSDYKIIHNYEGLGNHRVKVHQATVKEILDQGYERCQYISGIKVHLDQRISWLAQKVWKEMIDKSNQRSEIYLEMQKDEINSLKIQNAISIAVLFVPLFGTISGAISIHFSSKDKARLENTISYVKRIKSMLNNRVNDLEAYYIYIFEKNPNSEDSIKFARALSAYYNDGKGYVVGFYYGNQIQELNRYVDIENTFSNKFSAEMMLKLAKYEIKKKIMFSEKTRDLILKYMHNDFENPENSVKKARIKACYKITKHEPAYKNWNIANKKNVIKHISEYYVKENSKRKITFEQAHEELRYPQP